MKTSTGEEILHFIWHITLVDVRKWLQKKSS